MSPERVVEQYERAGAEGEPEDEVEREPPAAERARPSVKTTAATGIQPSVRMTTIDDRRDGDQHDGRKVGRLHFRRAAAHEPCDQDGKPVSARPAATMYGSSREPSTS